MFNYFSFSPEKNLPNLILRLVRFHRYNILARIFYDGIFKCIISRFSSGYIRIVSPIEQVEIRDNQRFPNKILIEFFQLIH